MNTDRLSVFFSSVSLSLDELAVFLFSIVTFLECLSQMSKPRMEKIVCLPIIEVSGFESKRNMILSRECEE